MKQKLLNIALISFLVILVNILLHVFVYEKKLPYYWANLDAALKRQYLINNKTKFNTIFIGSSKTHNQIVPEIFDEKSKENNLAIHSYNFGVSGMTPLESFHIYENLLNEDSLNFKNVFLELDWIASLDYTNLNVSRNYYWLNTNNYLCSVKSLSSSSIPKYRLLWGWFHYSLDYFENFINLGRVQSYLDFKHSSDSLSYSPDDSNAIAKGYIPLETNLHYTEKNLYNEVTSSSRECIKNFNQLEVRKPSLPFLKKLQDLIWMSKKRGVTLYFIIPLQWKYYQYQEIIPIISHLKGAEVICMFDVDKYKEVYKVENFADPNHLNSKGAKLYTEEVFKVFNHQH